MTTDEGQRFFDSRAAFTMFVTTTDEKVEIAERIARDSDYLQPGDWALRIFDAGMGDATVLGLLMRRLHRRFPHVPWRVVGKEISVEDVRHALSWLPDRFAEHPELVFVVNNLRYTDAPRLASRGDVRWRVHALDGETAHDFELQIRGLHSMVEADWAVMTSPKTGNPVPAHPAVHVFYRKDREFILRNAIPAPGYVDGEYDLIIASQPYRARSSAEHKVRTVVAPLARALAPGGRLIGIHGYGKDPGLEIIRGVWPEENPFRTGRAAILAEARRQLGSDHPDLEFPELSDAEAVFRFRLNAMPSEQQEHIGTSSILAAWNAAAYVAQIEEQRLVDALNSGAYLDATRRVFKEHGGVWFNDESYVIRRRV
ncbi:MAG: hypothetical protein OEM97_02760 [Acidimicrobiia bacterium]|nr:hypothetical protein [Acidimicrobiia bacterium]